jgi:hypothetical protein
MLSTASAAFFCATQQLANAAARTREDVYCMIVKIEGLVLEKARWLRGFDALKLLFCGGEAVLYARLMVIVNPLYLGVRLVEY